MGMGIDLHGVNIIHYGAPSSIENYSKLVVEEGEVEIQLTP